MPWSAESTEVSVYEMTEQQLFECGEEIGMLITSHSHASRSVKPCADNALSLRDYGGSNEPI